MKDPIATARAAAAGLDRGSLIDRDRAGTFDRSGWIAVAEAGLTGLGTEHGLAADAPTIARLLAAFGEECHDNGLSLALNAHLWGCVGPLMRFGTERQKAMHGSRLCDGSAIGALAATEPDAGSDLSTLSTRAERRDDGYLLNGRKLYVTNAPLADVVIVLAALDPERGPLGAAMFVVERGAPGLDTLESTELPDRIAVKGIEGRPIADTNATQIARLSKNDRSVISATLREQQADLEWFGYSYLA